MNRTAELKIRLTGKRFSPRKFKKQSGFKLEVITEPGEIAKSGRYKGKSIPYGSAYLIPKKTISNEELSDSLEEQASILLDLQEQLFQSGIEKIVFSVVANPHLELVFTPELIEKLHALNAKIDFMCIPEEISYPNVLFDVKKVFNSMENQHFIGKNQVSLINSLIKEEKRNHFTKEADLLAHAMLLLQEKIVSEVLSKRYSKFLTENKGWEEYFQKSSKDFHEKL